MPPPTFSVKSPANQQAPRLEALTVCFNSVILQYIILHFSFLLCLSNAYGKTNNNVQKILGRFVLPVYLLALFWM
jgi:hypothetical protein